MSLKELAVAHHLRITPYRYHIKIARKQWPVVETVGKMPTKVCADMNIADGILPTLPIDNSDVMIGKTYLHGFCIRRGL